MDDLAVQRMKDVARWLRVTAAGRFQHPNTVLFAAAEWLERPLVPEASASSTCKECGKPVPRYPGRGRRRTLCESCGRPPRLSQYRGYIAERVD